MRPGAHEPKLIPSRGMPDVRVTEFAYTVPGMSCGHCEQAVSSELRDVAGVQTVDVDLDSKRVVVRGEDLDDAVLKAAIQDAGYEAA